VRHRHPRRSPGPRWRGRERRERRQRQLPRGDDNYASRQHGLDGEGERNERGERRRRQLPGGDDNDGSHQHGLDEEGETITAENGRGGSGSDLGGVASGHGITTRANRAVMMAWALEEGGEGTGGGDNNYPKQIEEQRGDNRQK
jgi:hypothetical protein